MMDWEQQDESGPTLPVPLEMHELDMVTDPIKSIFRDILKWRVDPDGHYYGTSIDYLVDQIKLLNTGNVAAVSSDDKDFLDARRRQQRRVVKRDPLVAAFFGSVQTNITK